MLHKHGYWIQLELQHVSWHYENVMVWLGQLAALVHYRLPLLDVALPHHLLLPASPWCDPLSSSLVVWLSLMWLSLVVPCCPALLDVSLSSDSPWYVSSDSLICLSLI